MLTVLSTVNRQLKAAVKSAIGQDNIARWKIGRTGFWFVDIPRTGSTSLRAELGVEFKDLHGKWFAEDKAHATGQHVECHQSAAEMQTFFGPRKWRSLYTFSFVRNPWTRSLSYYHRLLKTSDIRRFTIGALRTTSGELRKLAPVIRRLENSTTSQTS